MGRLSILKNRLEEVGAGTGRGIFATEARKLGKSARTRARLMDAAVGVFARVGYEAASVNEIAQAAGVANGTFYLHFKSRNDIAAAVAFSIAADVVRQLDDAMTHIDRAVERTSFATRRFIDLACVEPEWGWALFHAAWYMPELRKQVVTYLRADLQRGVAQGVFNVKIDGFLIDMFASMVVTALFGRLRGDVGPEAGSKVAELQLRMLGVPAATAKRVAWRRIEPLALRAARAV
jgi:AcrR family transcriptional regulator